MEAMHPSNTHDTPDEPERDRRVMADLRARLDYRAQFEAAGESYSEADTDGHVIIRHPGHD